MEQRQRGQSRASLADQGHSSLLPLGSVLLASGLWVRTRTPLALGPQAAGPCVSVEPWLMHHEGGLPSDTVTQSRLPSRVLRLASRDKQNPPIPCLGSRPSGLLRVSSGPPQGLLGARGKSGFGLASNALRSCSLCYSTCSTQTLQTWAWDFSPVHQLWRGVL